MSESNNKPNSLFNISGKSALITGATGALGKVVAMSLASSGANLTLVAGNKSELEKIALETREFGASVITVNRRPESEADTQIMVDAAVSEFGCLDIVVVASGVNEVSKIEKFNVERWQSVINANVLGSWLVCKTAGKQLLKQGNGGKVLLISSTRGKLGHPAGYSAYCPSKSAVDGLVRSLACEWGESGINVNAIAPTVFRSNLTAWMFSEDDPGKTVREAMLSRIPLGRLGEPEDLIGAMLFLLSAASDFCTGQVLYIDGGYTAG